jgi:hypothetical protein
VMGDISIRRSCVADCGSDETRPSTMTTTTTTTEEEEAE